MDNSSGRSGRVLRQETARSSRRGVLAAGLIAVAGALAAAAPAGAAGLTERVSVATGGGEGNHNSFSPEISPDGRYVAFQSFASNLVAGDANGRTDIFVRDRHTGVTQRVNVANDGTEANHESFTAAISADARYVAFESFASNLVPADSNGTFDVFVHDRQSATTERVSLSGAGVQGNGDSDVAAISADGRYVAFESDASNLVDGDSNSQTDIFVHDRQTGATARVSVATGGGEANGFSGDPAISADGRRVSFTSFATNLVPADTNGGADVFVHDLQTGATERVSVAAGGGQAGDGSFGSALSSDARFVAFSSNASDLVAGDTNGDPDIFVHDRQSGVTERVTVRTGGGEANDLSFLPAISADGSHVAFSSFATNLVADDGNGEIDVFVHDRQTGVTERVSVAANGAQGDGVSQEAALSADGSQVAFTSFATNLVTGDGNASPDIFVRGRTRDAVPPVLTVPSTVTIAADSAAGRAVAYSASAVDDVDGAVPVSCSPASGTTFPIGTTTVSCSASDSAGNQTSGGFSVVVKGAAQQIGDLSTLVKGINLKQGIANSLDAKLEGVQDALASVRGGNSAAACSKLDAALSEIKAQAGKDITTAQADDLIDDINRIKTVIGCT